MSNRDSSWHVNLVPLFVYVTDHIYGNYGDGAGGSVEPACWVERDHPALVREGLELQRRFSAELLVSGSPEAGRVSVLSQAGELLLDVEWKTQTPPQAMGVDRD